MKKNKKEVPLVLKGNTVIKGTLYVKPITGDIIAFRDVKPLRE